MEKINKKYLLLIVEDEKILIDTLEDKLITDGFDVIKAFNGKEGLRVAIDRHPDLILLDLLMPEVDGVTMLKQLREDSWGANAKVIVLSNYIDANLLTQNIKGGLNSISEYMVKTDWSLAGIVSEVKRNLNINNN